MRLSSPGSSPRYFPSAFIFDHRPVQNPPIGQPAPFSFFSRLESPSPIPNPRRAARHLPASARFFFLFFVSLRLIPATSSTPSRDSRSRQHSTAPFLNRARQHQTSTSKSSLESTYSTSPASRVSLIFCLQRSPAACVGSSAEILGCSVSEVRKFDFFTFFCVSPASLLSFSLLCSCASSAFFLVPPSTHQSHRPRPSRQRPARNSCSLVHLLHARRRPLALRIRKGTVACQVANYSPG